jgi:PAS domain S-box-containing protein
VERVAVPGRASPGWPADLVGIIVLAAAYVAGAGLGFLLAPAHQVVSSAWPPAGVAVAALVLFGRRLWPGVALGAFLANFLSAVPPVVAAAIALGNTAEAVAAAWLLGRLGFVPALERLRDVFALVAVATLATVVSASVGVAALAVSGAASGHAAGLLWLIWWSGDAIGILIVGSLMLTWRNAPAWGSSSRSALEAVALVAALALTSAVLIRLPFPYVYPVFPLAGLAAYRLGSRGAAAANLTVTGVAAYFTVIGVGAFALPGLTVLANVFLFQGFVALLAVTTLSSAAVLAERRRAEDELRANDADLRAREGELRASEARLSQAVTELSRAQETLAASEAKFATLFRASPVAICVIAREGLAIVDANTRFFEMLGRSDPQSVIGASPRDLGMWAQPGELRDVVARLRVQGSIRETPVKYLTQDGHERRAVVALELIEIGGVESIVALFWRP